MKVSSFLYFFLIHCSVLVSAQKDHNILPFVEKVKEVQRLMKEHPEEAYYRVNELLTEAQKYNDPKSELLLYALKCSYFLKKADFGNLMTTAETYNQKAKQYNYAIEISVSYAYISNAYALNGLYEEAEKSLNKGLEVLDGKESLGDDLFQAKGKIYIEFANVSIVRKDKDKQIHYMKLAMKEHDKILNVDLKNKFKFRDFSNLAAVYYDFDIDSAEVYALKSMSLSDIREQNNDFIFNNYITLGVANKLKNKYSIAIAFYKKAEKIKENKHYPNIEEFYTRFIEIYEITGDSANIQKYRNELNLFKLEISESKNRSLHQIIEKKKTEDRSSDYLFSLIGSGLVILLLFTFLVIFYRRNRMLKEQEKKSSDYLQNLRPLNSDQQVKELIDIVSKNDPGFMFAFEKVHLDFTQKILSLYPEASKSDIEFCALVKLNLSTKEIARYKMIHVRSVQNRKYKIRKKLNIPSETDIYDWFRNF